MLSGGWGLVVAMLAVAWCVQMVLAYRQAQAFMATVRRLRGLGRTAIGVSSQRRWQRRTYVALAVDRDDRVAGAVQMSGLTVWARPRPLDALDGMPLAELTAGDDSPRGRAVAMAATSLRDGAGSGAGAASTSGVTEDDMTVPDEAGPEEVNRSG